MRSIDTHQLKRHDFKTKIWLLCYIEQMFVRLEPTPKCIENYFEKIKLAITVKRINIYQ